MVFTTIYRFFAITSIYVVIVSLHQTSGFDKTQNDQFNSVYSHQKIVNGTNAKLGDFPYLVNICDIGRPMCGGSIISALWVLTAGHCVQPYSDKLRNVQVQYGIINLTQTENMIPVKRLILHEKYYTSVSDNNIINIIENDIGLIELAIKIKFSEFVRPIGLPPSKFKLPVGKTALTAGWGYNKSGGTHMARLQLTIVKVLPQSECKRVNFPVTEIKDTAFCVLNRHYRGACQGDSGGPVVYRNIIIGLISYSMGSCGSKILPDVLTRVSKYRSWINSKSGV